MILLDLNNNNISQPLNKIGFRDYQDSKLSNSDMRFLGLKYDNIDMETALDIIFKKKTSEEFSYIVTPNAQHLVKLWKNDRFFVQGYRNAWLRLGDSRVVQTLSRILFRKTLPLVPGSDLTLAVLRRIAHSNDPICVIGGDQELALALQEQFNLSNLHHYAPPMEILSKPFEQQACVDFVIRHPSRFIFLAIGAPQSEHIAARIRESGRATGIGFCIGSSLHFATGLVRRAPKWVRWCSLEWAYRLVTSPRRHFKRVFRDSMPVLFLLIRARFGDPHPLRHVDEHDPSPSDYPEKADSRQAPLR